MAEETTVENPYAWPRPAWPEPAVPPPGGPQETAYGPSLPGFPPPPPPPPPYGAARGRSPRRLLVAGLVTALLAVGVTVAGSQAPSEPKHPSAWDSRVTDLVKYVEGEKRLTFKHPVYVDFLPESDFVPEIQTEDRELTASDREDMDQAAGMFHALGMIGHDVDLLAAVNQFQGEAALAFYDPRTQRVRVKGTDLTVSLKATLVHELTHALQDQYFDLEREGSFDVDGQNDTFRPIFEGDAQRVSHAWVGTLNAADLAAYDQAQQDDVEAADLGNVPDAITQFMYAPYVLGEPYVDVLVSAQGRSAVDDALRDPPHADADLLDPFRTLEHVGRKEVATPKLGDGEKKLDDGSFGAVALYLVLAQRMDGPRALNAVDTWGGDAYVSYQKDGKSCMKADFAGRDSAGTSTLASVLEVWANALPQGMATITRHDDLVRLQSCDPGADAVLVPGNPLDMAVGLVATRTNLALGMMSAGLTPVQARCSAQHFLSYFSPAELPTVITATSVEDIPADKFEAASQGARDACGVK